MRIPVLILFLLLASVVRADVGYVGPVLYTTINSFTFSETTSIDSLLHDFRGDIRSGERASTFNRAEVGLRYQWLSLGYQQRYDYFLRFNNDVARAYHASAHDKVLPEGYAADVFIQASQIRAKGATLGIHLEPLPRLQLSVVLARLTAHSMVDGEASGELAVTDEDSYDGAVDFLLHSSEDLLLEMPVPDPVGKGYAADVMIDWEITDRWQIGLLVFDAYSRIEWEDVLFSDLHANTATVSYDENGQLHTNPVLYGYQYLTDITQTLPRKYQGRLAYRLTGQHRLFVEQFYVPDYASQSTLGYEYGFSDQRRLGGYWNVSTRAVGVTGQWHWISWRMGTDNLDGREARAWDLALGLQIPLFW